MHKQRPISVPSDPNPFRYTASASIPSNASFTHSESNRFSCLPFTPTHFTPMPCFKISVVEMHDFLPSSHTVILRTSTATSVLCRYTRWVINADVGYDFEAPSDSWTELSVWAIALASGQHKLESTEVLGTILDKIHTRITFCLSVVLGIHCLLYQQQEQRVRGKLGIHVTALLPSMSVILRCLWQLLVEQGKAQCYKVLQYLELESRSDVAHLVHRDPHEYTRTCPTERFVRKSGLGYGCISFP